MAKHRSASVEDRNLLALEPIGDGGYTYLLKVPRKYRRAAQQGEAEITQRTRAAGRADQRHPIVW